MTEERYEIRKQSIGTGGFGVVDKAFDKMLERLVAIKTLNPIFKDIEPKDIERFHREAKALAKLSHPNIPSIHDIIFNNGNFQIITEWIDGLTIREHLIQKGIWGVDFARKYFTTICQALEHAHANGIIHRDIKPANLIISEDFESCYIVDFGLSLDELESVRLSMNSRVGTAGYMSPEQRDGKPVDSRTDIYSLGLVLYEVLSGTKPSLSGYVNLSEINENIPPQVDQLIRACLDDDPAKRPASPRAFLKIFDEAFTSPHDFSTALTGQPLYVIFTKLQQMSCDDFINLHHGTKRLLLTKIRGLVSNRDAKINNATADLLSQCIRLSQKSPHFSEYLKYSIEYGYLLNYTSSWMGNSTIRKTIKDLAETNNDEVYRELINNITPLFQKEELLGQGWFLYDIRILIECLMINMLCTETDAETMGNFLDNTLAPVIKSRKATAQETA